MKGFTQKELAEKVEMGDTTIANYEKGFRTPKKNTLFKLANAFDIPIDDLFPPIEKSSTLTSNVTVQTINDSTLQEINDTSKQLNPDRQIVVLDTAKNQLAEQVAEENTVENSKDTVDNIIQFPKLYEYPYYDHPASAGTGQYLNDVPVEIIELPVDVDADFVIPIYGDSMEPEYHSGDYIFVKLSVELSDGDIGVFEYYGDAYVKQLLINDSGAFLHSLNTEKYEDIPIDANSDFRIIGEVVGIYREN